MLLGYGKGAQPLHVPDRNLLGVLMPNAVGAESGGEAEVLRALENPIGSPRLRDIAKPGEKIAVITSDITRPMPTHAVMPALLNELYEAGVRPSDISLVFALGSHRPHTDAEMKALAGDRAHAEIHLVDASPDDCVHFGTTRRGTPVDIDRTVAGADRRILLGNIEYHYFAGYSGGGKAIMPGVSTREAIQSNHRFMVDPDACAGRIDGNPVREDIEEAALMVGADFILNVVLNEHKRIVKAVAGDMIGAHREGCRFLDRMYAVSIPARADIVVVSQGGAPKDLNLYQVQKALDNAKHAVREGGTIILVGACGEGLGERVFEEWITSAPTPKSLIARIAREFRLGGHKAAAIAMVLESASISLVSELDPALVKRIFMDPHGDVQSAFDAAFAKYADPTVLVMPYGGSTLPKKTIVEEDVSWTMQRNP